MIRGFVGSMRTWIVLDEKRMGLRSRDSCYEFRRRTFTIGFLVVAGFMILAATSRFPVVRMSTQDQGSGISKIFRSLHVSWGDESSKKLPDALLIGAKKAGTRALLQFIRIHPSVRAAGREMHFFDKNYSLGTEWYRNMMPTSIKGQITIEKSPSYMLSKEAPARVQDLNEKMKLIVILKDPVERAISDYTQSKSKVENPAMELKKLENFLNLKPVITEEHFYFNSTKGFPCLKKSEASGAPHCLGESKGRKHPNVSAYAKMALYDFYRSYNKKLYETIGIDFKWDRRKPE